MIALIWRGMAWALGFEAIFVGLAVGSYYLMRALW